MHIHKNKLETLSFRLGQMSCLLLQFSRRSSCPDLRIMFYKVKYNNCVGHQEEQIGDMCCSGTTVIFGNIWDIVSFLERRWTVFAGSKPGMVAVELPSASWGSVEIYQAGVISLSSNTFLRNSI